MTRSDGATWAILVAAGSGERLGADRPKAFVALGERVLLAESLERLDGSDWVDAVVVAVPADWEEAAIVLAEELVASKVAAVVPGGATRAESVRAALAEVPDDALVVIVHDAARPLVDDEVIGRVIEPLAEGYDGVVPGLALADTVKRVERGVVVETVERSQLVAVQTPQAFTAIALRAAYAAPEPLAASDCAVTGRGARRSDPRRRGRSPAAQDHDGSRPRARRIMALKAVFFDVGETLVDEERWWRVLAGQTGLQPHVIWAALGVTIERGEEHNELWRHLGIEQPTTWWHGLSYELEISTPTRSSASNASATSACGSASSGTRRPRSSSGPAMQPCPPT